MAASKVRRAASAARLRHHGRCRTVFPEVFLPRPDGQISKGEPAGSSDDQVTGAHEGSQLSPLPATRDTTRLPDDGATRLATGDATRLATGDATTLATGDATTLATGDETRLDPDLTRLPDADDLTRLPDSNVSGA